MIHGNVIEPIVLPATYELVVERIRRAIHTGVYVTGDKLPAERILAQQLAVSRWTVREAIRVLEGEGYLESRRGANGGALISPRGQAEGRMSSMVRDRLDEFEDLLDYRKANECAAAGLAAQRRTAADLETLTAAFNIMEQGLEIARFRAADSAFHRGIADAARNSYMRTAIEDARAAMWIPIDARTAHAFRTAHDYHGQVLAAIRAGDARRAEGAMAEHLEVVRQDLRRIAASRDE